MSRLTTIENLVSVDWLQKHLDAKNLVILDATISKVIGDVSDLSNSQIPNTRFFDIKKQFSNTKSTFPNTIPSAIQFETPAQSLGINDDSVIVIYDYHGVYSSARAWWLLKTFGFKNVAVLNGGFPEWRNKGFKIEKKTNKKSFKKGDFKANYKPDSVVYFDSLEAITKDSNFKIIDARSSDRFNCIVAEPRKGLRSGRIPTSTNLPFNQVLSGNIFKSKTELQNIFKSIANNNQHLVFTCGSGITASVLALAATIAGYKNSVYDGSWTEYGTLTIA
ncbi:sulfurtransferase [Lacinutrix sp. MedPE-SW]|uniref:sulfurtransferase n=1 Tax=Lacinutrix sp. MedPE-SW TaxID=1860087 RepID=UPI00091A4E71|nr:sulfurtransferase [Lacinutrix sp. MedPE-SW]OIQ23792.1 MAG: sulfurtransferase [Lacinutrix sp. MedPE-SW]